MTTSYAPITVATVVEGHGEAYALPKLLHRIAADLDVTNLRVPDPKRKPRGSVIRTGGIEDAVQEVAIRVRGDGGILVLLDADDDCPAECGTQLLQRARRARSDKRVAVVLANREYEAWFLAAAPSLAGQHRISSHFGRPANPESPRDCKGLITKDRPKGDPYSETADQLLLTSIFDMKMAREHSDSFDKLYRDVSWLLGRSL